jgi:CheY-like chemotaxis protein
VVVSDRFMPGMGGELLACRLKALSPHTPVLLLTGAPPIECTSAVDEVVRKPFTGDALAEAIARSLAAHSEVAAAVAA